jgi:hypothetical protein
VISLKPSLPLSWKLVGTAAVLIGVFLAGWHVRGWKADSDELIAQKASARTVEVFREHEANVAKTLEEKLAQLKANSKVVERHYETQKVFERPVYRNECVDDDGLRYIEAKRTGTLPTEPASQMPAASEPAPGR